MGHNGEPKWQALDYESSEIQSNYIKSSHKYAKQPC